MPENAWVIASEPISIEATDGYSLAATVFTPPATRVSRHVVVVASAMGVRHPFYYPFSEYLSARGVATVTFDYRGVGRSRPDDLRGFPARLLDWGRVDLASVLTWTRDRFPGLPTHVVAHSVGGQILGLASPNGRVSSVLAVAAQSGYWGHWKGLGRLRVATLWFVLIPVLTRAFGYFPSRWLGIGDDLPAGVAREWAFWGRHPDYLLGRLPRTDRSGFEGYRGRLRVLRMSDDELAPESAVNALLAFYPNAKTERYTLRPHEAGIASLGHFGFFRETVGARVWPEQVDWLLRS